MLAKLIAELKAIQEWPAFKDENLTASEMASIPIRRERTLELLGKIEKIVQSN